MNKEIQKIKPNGVFTNYIYKSIPLAFDESMSYYETLCGLLSILKTQEEVINNNADLLAELELYVQNYFKNLDVQTEINNKLDEMAQSGQLTDIIAQYLELAGVLSFNTVNDMKNATNITNGSTCKTLGENSFNDGLGRFYKIRNITNTDIIDNINIIPITTNNNLIAELITEKYLQDIEELKTDLIPFACIIRPTSNGWIILNDENHEPLNVQGIEIAGESENQYLLLHHNNGASKIYGFNITSDETFAKYGIRAGASVGLDSSKIFLYMSIVANAYFRVNEGQIVLQNVFSNLVQSIQWDSSKNCVRVVFDNNLKCATQTYWNGYINPSLSIITKSLNQKVQVVYSDSLTLEIYLYDESNNKITNINEFDRINVKYEINNTINPVDLVSYPISEANFWITGWLKK